MDKSKIDIFTDFNPAYYNFDTDRFAQTVIETFFERVVMNEDPKSRKNELLRFLKKGLAGMWRLYMDESLADYLFDERWHRNHLNFKITDIIEYLLDTGLVDISELKLLQALWPATVAESKHDYDMELIRMLVARGINVREPTGIPPLHEVAMHGLSTELAELLLSNGANVHDLDKEGNTALHKATEEASSYPDEMMKFLIKRGADVNAVNKKGQTPITMIARILRFEYNWDLVGLQRGFRYCMQELSRLSFENRPICKANLNLIKKNAQAQEYLAAGKAELENMSATTFHAALTYYSVYKHSPNIILARYVDNEVLRDKFEKNLSSYPMYKDDLKERFEEAMELGRKVKRMEGTIDEIFSNLFPSVVSRRISEYVLVAECRASLKNHRA